MEKLIFKYLRHILALITLISVFLLAAYHQLIGIDTANLIESKMSLYFSYIFNPFSTSYSSFYRFVIIIFCFLFSIYSLIQLIKQERVLSSIVQFLVINLAAFLLVSIDFRHFLYFLGIVVPIALIGILNHTSLVSFKKKLTSGLPIEEVEKDFFDKFNALVDKFLVSEDKKNVLKFESNYRKLVNNHASLSERSEKIAKSIKDFLFGILSEIKKEFSNTNLKLKSLEVEQSDARNLKDKIDQYESGYAYTIIKNYFKQLLILRNNLKDRYKDNEDNLYIDKLFSSYLSGFSIIYTVFIVGNEFNPERMEIVAKIKTDDPNLDNKIESILAQGYFIDIGSKEKVIEKAQVKVYSFKKEEK
jgi:molecular chaperone GrpE (heat shock protein)